jgi:hypothetical protein
MNLLKQSASALHLNFPKMFKSSVQSLVTLSEQGNFSPFGIAAHCPLGVQYLPLKKLKIIKNTLYNLLNHHKLHLLLYF